MLARCVLSTRALCIACLVAGNARKGIFLVDPDRELFLKVLAKVMERFNWRCPRCLTMMEPEPDEEEEEALQPVT